MSIRIEACIIDYLQDHAYLEIPGLGSFTLITKSRAFTLEDDVISPPFKSLEFKNQTSESLEFVTFVAEKWGIELQAAQQKVSQFVESVLRSVLKDGKAEINDIGIFHSKEDQSLQFESNSANFDLNYFGLDRLKLTPIRSLSFASPQITDINQIDTESSIDQTIENDLEFLPSRVSMLALFGFIAILIIMMKACDNKIGINKTVVSQMNAISLSNSPSDPSGSSLAIHHPSSIADSLFMDSLSKENSNISKYRDVLNKDIVDVGCIAIVGSFTKAYNVIRMKDAIIRAGLQPYTEEYNDFTRVGILFECADEDLVEYLQSLRLSFDAKAWLLQPNFEVPYQNN